MMTANHSKKKNMKKLTITAKELRAIGYPESPVIPVAMNIIQKHYRFSEKADTIKILSAVLNAPDSYWSHEILRPIADKLLPAEREENEEIGLRSTGVPFNLFGQEHIEQGAIHQMHIAAKLPISVAGALMPDAHYGYGLPIGGVLATNNAVIPYGVGVDIGCRMCLSIFDISSKELIDKERFFSREIHDATLFGSGAEFTSAEEHAVMDRNEFTEIALLRKLQGKAAKQLGSSGSGNHFVEFGIVQIKERDEIMQIDPGEYVGLLSHSGSRGLGANIAKHYTQIAIDKRRLPGEAKNLAWLDLSEEEGQEYWLAMNLAGDYASACHHIIHGKIAKQLGREPLRVVENHHNFAWKEMHEGNEVIVHRKGGTPAGKNVLGIIPGSMATPGFIVKGRGEAASLNSAAHGAGRKMSRSAAMQSITHSALHEELKRAGVKLLSGSLDEAPFAYKDINQVMQAQKQLVDTVGLFIPKIVKMCGGEPKPWRSKNS